MNEQRKIRVAIVFGGRGPEHSVSCMGGGNMLGAIDRDRYEVVPVGITRDGRWVLAADEPARLTAAEGRLPSVEAVAEPGTQVVPWASQAPAARAPGQAGQALVASAPGQIPHLLGEVDVVLPVLHGRSARTAPSRACWRWPASRMSGRGCWPARSAWTRST